MIRTEPDADSAGSGVGTVGRTGTVRVDDDIAFVVDEVVVRPDLLPPVNHGVHLLSVCNERNQSQE